MVYIFIHNEFLIKIIRLLLKILKGRFITLFQQLVESLYKKQNKEPVKEHRKCYIQLKDSSSGKRMGKKMPSPSRG